MRTTKTAIRKDGTGRADRVRTDRKGTDYIRDVGKVLSKGIKIRLYSQKLIEQT
jgi:hypothetical protein